MTGPTQTRIVLFVTLILLICWEGYCLIRWGKTATISHVMGEMFLNDPFVLILVVGFLMHCLYSVKNPPLP